MCSQINTDKISVCVCVCVFSVQQVVSDAHVGLKIIQDLK